MRVNFARANGTAQCARWTAKGKGTAAFAMCRTLADAGLPDCALEFYDERGRHAYTIQSMWRGAQMTVSETDTGVRFGRYTASPWAERK